MNTEIYYFSGTGNSFFIARELQKRIPDSQLVPIACLLKNNKIIAQGKTVGIVFPVHALTIPIAVKMFLDKIELNAAKYIFAVATRQGTVFYGFKKIQRQLKKQKKRLDAQFVIDMFNNDVKFEHFHIPSPSDIAKMEKKVLERLDLIRDIVLSKGHHRENIRDHKIKSAPARPKAFLIDRTVLAAMALAEHTGGVNYFYRDDKCTGCGICEKVCLSQKIKMDDKRPTWQKNVFCYMCYACINFCPAAAIQVNSLPYLKSHTRENGRYPHPYATVTDMQRQKQVM